MAQKKSRGLTPQIKVLLLVVALAAFTAGIALYYLQPKWVHYTDAMNGVTLEKPDHWQAGSIEGYVRVAEDTGDVKKPSILIKIDYPESIIPALDLDKAPEVQIGGKTVRRADHEWEVPSRPTTTITYTHLMWQAPNGKQVIFEISPMQKQNVDPSVERILRTFTL